MYRKLLIVGLLLLTFSSLSVYAIKTHQYPQWDEHHYLTIAVKTLDAVHTKGLIGFADVISISTYRQPLYPLLLALLLSILGTAHTYVMALIVNAGLYTLTIFATYLVARYFFKPWISILAAVIAATYGNGLFYAHFTYVETAVTTMIVWGLYWLLRTDGFRRRKYSLIAGLWIALATLTRFIAPVFLIGPLLGLLLQLCIERQKSTKDQWQNVTILLGLAIGIPLILYFIPNHQSFLEYVHNNQTLGPGWVAQYRDPAMANTFSVRSIMYYFNIIQQKYRTALRRICRRICSGKPLSFLKNIVTKKDFIRDVFKDIFISGIHRPLLFFNLVTIWKEDRFLVSIYPDMALLSVVALQALSRWKKVFITTVTIVIVISIMNAYGGLFGIGPMGKQGLVDYVTPTWIPHPRRLYLTPLVWPPTKEYSNADIFVKAIQQDWKGSEKAKIGLTFNHEPFINAVNSILTYEKRSLGELKLDQTATQTASLDYLVSQSEITPGSDLHELNRLIIPYDKSPVFIYKH